MRLLQYQDDRGSRRVAVTEANDRTAVPLAAVESVYELVKLAWKNEESLTDTARARLSSERVELQVLTSERRLLPPVDHPDQRRVWVSGTGFSHMRPELRDDTYRQLQEKELTGGLTEIEKLKLLALRDGKPKDEAAGALNELFLKGDGTALVPPGGILAAPDFSLGFSEESEIAGIYMINPAGRPVRLGFCQGNEFADCETEKQNAYFLGHSKIQPCAIGPELVIGQLPDRIVGRTRLMRGDELVLEYEFHTGEDNMVLSLANIEHHLFKHPLFRQAGDVHIHFFGTGARPGRYQGATYEVGDTIEISAPGFGLPLRVELGKAEIGYQQVSVLS